jgi:hypothetical protein
VPSGVATGGPEALHELAYDINNKTKENLLDVLMFYVGDDSPVVPEVYKKYSLPVTKTIPDDPETLIITPEFYPHMKIALAQQRSSVIVWWLSVDFFFSSFVEDRIPWFQIYLRGLLKIYNFTIGQYTKKIIEYSDIINSCRNFIWRRIDLRNVKIHLHQSTYAKCFLNSKNIESLPLGDRFEKEFNYLQNNKKNFYKQDIILYNPKKGKPFIDLLKKRYPALNFQALSGLTRPELIKKLQTSKVYLDLGSHPGRDRIPREAALCGCVVITGSRGSAKTDIPVSDKFRVETTSQLWVLQTGELLQEVLQSYTDNFEEQKKYRMFIKSEDRMREQQVRQLLENLDL